MKFVKPEVLVGVSQEDLLLVNYSSREDLDLLIDYTLHNEVQDAVEEWHMTPAQHDKFYK